MTPDIATRITTWKLLDLHSKFQQLWIKWSKKPLSNLRNLASNLIFSSARKFKILRKNGFIHFGSEGIQSRWKIFVWLFFCTQTEQKKIMKWVWIARGEWPVFIQSYWSIKGTTLCFREPVTRNPWENGWIPWDSHGLA